MVAAQRQSIAAFRIPTTKTIAGISLSRVTRQTRQGRVAKSAAALAAFIGASFGARREPDEAAPLWQTVQAEIAGLSLGD